MIAIFAIYHFCTLTLRATRHHKQSNDMRDNICAREIDFFFVGKEAITAYAHHYRTTIRGIIEGDETRIPLEPDAAVARDVARQRRRARRQPARPARQDRDIGLASPVEAGDEPIDMRVRIVSYSCPRLGDDGQYVHSAALLDPARSRVREQCWHV